MKIVIDMPDVLKNQMNDDNYENIIRWYSTTLYCAIKEGIVLPKGHDRLVYAEDVKENHRKWIGYLDGDMIARLNIAIDKYVPTIIEAARDSLEWSGKNCVERDVIDRMLEIIDKKYAEYLTLVRELQNSARIEIEALKGGVE